MTSLAVEVAERVSRAAERRYRLERGALLSIAWMGALKGAQRWRPERGAPERAFVTQLARWAIGEAVRNGELDGRRSRCATPVSVTTSAALEPTARHDHVAEADARDEVDGALERVRMARAGERCARILKLLHLEGMSQTEVAARLGVTQPRVSVLCARAMHVARAGAA